MSNILQAKIEIIGTRPFLYDAFGRNSIPLEKQERQGVAGNNPTEWKEKVLHTSKGQLYIPSSYIFGCLKNAAIYTKSGRGSIQNALCSTLVILNDNILIERFIPGFNGHLPDTMPEDFTLPVYLDVRSSVNPTTKGRNIRYRVAMSPGYRLSFGIQWDKTIINRNQMEAVCIDAGKLVGIGSGRKIGMGRFDIKSFEIQE